jgi:hypothetical protein
MKITIESTAKIVQLHDGNVGDSLPARIWVGTTESGIPVHCYVTRISPQTHDTEANNRFAQELQECAAPTAEVEAIPMRMIL